MVTPAAGVDALLAQVSTEPYRTPASWTNTRTFALTGMLQLGVRPFELDNTLADSDHGNGSGTVTVNGAG